MSNVVEHCRTFPNIPPGGRENRSQLWNISEGCRTFLKLLPGVGEGIGVKRRTLANVVEHIRICLQGEGKSRD